MAEDIIENIQLDERDAVFHVKPMNWLKFIIFGGIFNFLWIYLLKEIAIILILPIIFTGLLLWKNLGTRVTEKLVLNTIHRYKARKKSSIFAKLIGFNLDPQKKCYLEGRTVDLNLNKSIKIFRERILELILTCTGFSYILLQLYISIGNIDLSQNPETLIMIPTIIVSLMPLVVFWLIPIIWTLDDVQIIGIDKAKRGGILSKVIGLAGIILEFDFIRTLAVYYGKSQNLMTDDWLIVLVSIFFVCITIIFGSGTSYLIGILYLQKFHEPFINRLRNKVSQIIPIGITSVRTAHPEEISLIQQQR